MLGERTRGAVAADFGVVGRARVTADHTIANSANAAITNGLQCAIEASRPASNLSSGTPCWTAVAVCCNHAKEQAQQSRCVYARSCCMRLFAPPLLTRRPALLRAVHLNKAKKKGKEWKEGLIETVRDCAEK